MIKEFKGETKWLSNFALVKIVLDGIEYPSTEHAYMSAKCSNPTWKKVCANPTITCGQIKFLGGTVKLVDNWNDIKLDVMTDCIQQKFVQEPYRTMLIETGDQFLQEGNNWGDLIWGVDIETGEGQNLLGKLIMNVREGINFMDATSLLSNKTND